VEALSPVLSQQTSRQATGLDARPNVAGRQPDGALGAQPFATLVPTTAQPAAPKHPWEAWKVFGTTFATVFLAELGDKTQVSTLLMSAEFHAPWVVFTGAAIALVTTSLLGVLIGQWLACRLSAKTLDTAAGITLALISLGLLWDVAQR
jgi:putative Ca2+/H+ antiporter (TMEM165/GDT1 family)